MAQDEPPESSTSGFGDSEVVDYQAVSGLAVIGLLVGLASALALIWPWLWIAALVGIVLNFVALVRIAMLAPSLTGGRLAIAGLLVSVFFTAMVPTNWLTYRWAIRRQARQVASLWFDALQNDQPVKAYQLSLDPRYRRPLDELARKVRQSGSTPRTELRTYVDQPDVRCLLALDGKAQVRHYATEDQFDDEKRHEFVVEVYAVTFDEQGQKKTFFVRLTLERYDLPSGLGSDWQVASTQGGYHPIALGGSGK